MKALITGGCGFIGSSIAKFYLDKGCEVVIVDDLSRRGAGLNLEWLKTIGHVDFVKVNIVDYKTLKRTIEQHRDMHALFHMAAQVAVTDSVFDPRKDFEINALGTFNLLEAVREAHIDPVIIFASTNKVYGEMVDLETVLEGEKYKWKKRENGIDEDRPLDFHSPYGCSKGCADQYIRDYSRMYGLRTIVMRQSCIYGPRQFGIEDQGWVAWFIIAAVLGKKITIYGDGKQVRDILYVDDLIEVFHRAYEHVDKTEGEIFNIGGGMINAMSPLELIDILKKEVAKDIRIEYGSWRPGDQKIYISNISKSERVLGWRPKVDKLSGVKKLISWVKENRSLFSKL